MMKKKILSTQHTLYITFWAFTLPALLLIFLLTFYTIQRQIAADTEDYQSRLSLYSSTMERVLKHSENQLNNIIALETPFQAFHYCNTRLQKHNYAWEVMRTLKPLLTQEPLFGGIFLYSENFSYYYPAYQINYPHSDQNKIKSFLTETKHSYLSDMNRWIPLRLSDRTVLMRISGFEDTICAFMIDPSLDENVAPAPSPSPTTDTLLFYASKDGTPYTLLPFSAGRDMHEYPSLFRGNSPSDRNYQFIQKEVADYDLQLCYLIPRKGVWDRLNLFQKLLLAAIIILLLSIPAMWGYLYKKLLNPLNTLSETMKKAGNGDLSLRVDENLPVLELQNLSHAFNRMLFNIQNLKLESYEKKLDLQQAQLQYLQLQIRPHFYLNCLKGLYGMAEKQQYHDIQETLLALSDYFRYIFRNNMAFVSLADEIRSVSSYLKLQKLNFSRHITFTMDIAAETTDINILPLSILTFVENSVKHCQAPANLKLHIKTALILAEGSAFLNIIISDNGGGFSAEMLNTLNHLNEHDFLYKDYSTGIYNIFYRTRLTYNEKAVLAFYNKNDGGCVDLYIPAVQEEEFEK